MKPVDLSFSVLKEQGPKWLMGMFEYICDNPQIIANGFIHSGFTAALDADLQSETLLSEESGGDSNVDSSSSEVEC